MGKEKNINKNTPDAPGLLNELQECQKLKDEYLAGWQRARADLINYKKEEEERVGNLTEYVAGEFAVKLLPILDNFEQALQQGSVRQIKDKGGGRVIEGFENIKKQFQDFLKGCGLKEIKTIGERVDLQYHETIEEVNDEKGESGIIVEELQKGYILQGRVLRAAKVKVAR